MKTLAVFMVIFGVACPHSSEGCQLFWQLDPSDPLVPAVEQVHQALVDQSLPGKPKYSVVPIDPSDGSVLGGLKASVSQSFSLLEDSGLETKLREKGYSSIALPNTNTLPTIIPNIAVFLPLKIIKGKSKKLVGYASVQIQVIDEDQPYIAIVAHAFGLTKDFGNPKIRRGNRATQFDLDLEIYTLLQSHLDFDRLLPRSELRYWSDSNFDDVLSELYKLGFRKTLVDIETGNPTYTLRYPYRPNDGDDDEGVTDSSPKDPAGIVEPDFTLNEV